MSKECQLYGSRMLILVTVRTEKLEGKRKRYNLGLDATPAIQTIV